MQDILLSFGLPIVVVGLAIAAFSAFLVFARNYRKCPPNEVLVVYGRKHRDGKGYRLIAGGSAFVLPLFESAMEITLETFALDPSVKDTPNKDGVPVSVDATANVKVSSEPTVLPAAIERMLGKTNQEIHAMLKTTLEGLLRQIIGTLSVEDIIREREALAQAVLKGATAELNKLGFQIDVFVINKIWDDKGYIEALGVKQTAAVKRDATIAQAEADREATVKSAAAKQEAETAKRNAEAIIASAQRDLSIKVAAFKQETETASAAADMARALKEAEVDRELRQRRVAALETETTAKIKLAEQEATRREAELVAQVIKPAEADKKAAIVRAEASGQALTITATCNATAAVKQAEATKAEADATKAKLTLEGEGRAAAEAAQKRQLGLAEGEAIRARGEAEGAAVAAKLLAEALGLQKKNEALAQMSDAARLIIVLERLPEIIDQIGDAGQKVVGAAFEHIGAGVSRIDSVHLIDLGGGGRDGSDPVSRFALSIPKTVFGVIAQAKAMGMDIDTLLEKVGVPRGALTGILDQLKSSTQTASSEN